MSPNIPVFHDGVVVTPDAERFTLWRKAYKAMDYVVTSRVAIQNLRCQVGCLPELTTAEIILDDIYEKQQDILWLYSEDIVHFAPQADQDKMLAWADDCDKDWDGTQWIDKE